MENNFMKNQACVKFFNENAMWAIQFVFPDFSLTWTNVTKIY